jgi:sarcosine oxidase gamma subunit
MSRPVRTSPALRIFVPAYLVVIGLGLLAGAVALLVYSPDEWFVMTMAAVGGLTMLATAAAMLTVARDR